MIAELSVENLAIIDRSTIEFGKGFTVLTGETGAGKSLLVDAIELALGERADTDLVRTGARSASVSVTFDFSNSPKIQERCLELGFELEDGLLFISREVFVEGRSQSRIQGRQTPNSTLKGLGQLLIDLHGQHDHQSLLFPERHIGFLDQWIGAPAFQLLDQTSALYQKLLEVRRKIEALRTGMRERAHRLDLLTHQVNEIETVSPVIGELETLETQISRLQNAERLTNAVHSARTELIEDEGSAIDRLGIALRLLHDASRYDPALQALVAPLHDALYQLEEGINALGPYSESLESDPTTLEETASRIDALKRLRRKYGDNEESVLQFLDVAKEQLEILQNAESAEEGLSTIQDQLSIELSAISAELSALRKENAVRFSSLVEVELKDLAMERARFQVEFKEREADGQGSDEVEFYFSANLGEPPRPLSKIASGGEVSRLMLAIKSVLAGTAGVPTLIFDEVDSGLGGRVAATLGRKLEYLARNYQVLVISHLPQVAARASAHYKIEKIETEERVVTRVRLLNDQERIEELARMLAGEALTEAAIANAKEMLSSSQVVA